MLNHRHLAALLRHDDSMRKRSLRFARDPMMYLQRLSDLQTTRCVHKDAAARVCTMQRGEFVAAQLRLMVGVEFTHQLAMLSERLAETEKQETLICVLCRRSPCVNLAAI